MQQHQQQHAAPTGSSSRISAPRVLITGAAVADGRGPDLRRGVSLLIENGRISWIRADGEAPDASGAEVIDASGATVVPALVDAHCHVTMPGGARWVRRGADPTEALLAVAEENGELMLRAGVRYARDMGAPAREDPPWGGTRAASLTVRDRWRGRGDRPYLRAAGTWITGPRTLPHGLGRECADGDALLAAATGQLDDGADMVKLFLDGPDRETCPFTVGEVRAVVVAAAERGARVAAHASKLACTRVAAEAGVASIEHGYQLDRDVAAVMARGGVVLVPTLMMLHSRLTFTRTADLPAFRDPDAPASLAASLEAAEHGVRLAHEAGVAIAGGSDSGGGSPRANLLAWEAEALVRAGLEPWEALAALTWRGGELMGDPRAGRIVVGRPAHLALVHGDPLSDPTALWRVWLTV